MTLRKNNRDLWECLLFYRPFKGGGLNEGIRETEAYRGHCPGFMALWGCRGIWKFVSNFIHEQPSRVILADLGHPPCHLCSRGAQAVLEPRKAFFTTTFRASGS